MVGSRVQGAGDGRLPSWTTRKRCVSTDPGQLFAHSSFLVLLQVQPGSVQGAPWAASVGLRVGNTFSWGLDPELTRGAHFHGDETDKDFKFVAGDGAGGGDKTMTYDPKNFYFKLKNRDSVLVEAREGRCSWRHMCCNSLYLTLATITFILIINLLSTSS